MYHDFGVKKDFNASSEPESKMYVCKRDKFEGETPREYMRAKDTEWEVYTFPDKLVANYEDGIFPFNYEFTTTKSAKTGNSPVDVYTFLSAMAFIVPDKNNRYNFYMEDGLKAVCVEPTGPRFATMKLRQQHFKFKVKR